MDPVIFLDRDGVIIENRPTYVRSWADVAVYPQALNALAQISASPYKIIVVTNQSMVGRGYVSLNTAWDINKRLVKVIEQSGGRIDQVFMCPHAPQEMCDCRKPRPGLLFQAQKALSLDLSQSMMIGDALSDLQAGHAAGVRQNVLVRTGRGSSQAQGSIPEILKPLQIYDTLADALEKLINI